MWVKVRPNLGSATLSNLDLSQVSRVFVFERSGLQGWSVSVDSVGLFDNAHGTQPEAEAEMLALIRPDGIRWIEAEDGSYLSLTEASELRIIDDGGWRLRVFDGDGSATNCATVYAGGQVEAQAALDELVAALGEWVYP